MEAKQVKQVFSRIGLALVVMVAVQQALVYLVASPVALYQPGLATQGWFMWALSYLPLYCVGFPLALLVLRGIPNHTGGPPEKKQLSPLGLAAATCALIAVVITLSLLSAFIERGISLLTGRPVVNQLGELVFASDAWVNFIAVGLVAPVMEELLFRGILYKKLVVFGGKAYILVSAFVFSLFHANLSQLLYSFVIGVVLAAITYFTGTIRYSILLHILVNTLGSGGSYMVLSYAGPDAYMVWNLLLYVVAAAGLVVIVWWLAKKRHSLLFSPAQVALPSRAAIFVNPGMLLFLLVFVGLTLFAIVFA